MANQASSTPGGSIQPDYSDDRIDISKDDDFVKLRLKIERDLTSGTVELGVLHSNGSLIDPTFYGLQFFSEDGSTEITDLSVDMSAPGSHPLAAIDTDGVVLLFESTDARASIPLILRYTDGNSQDEDRVNLHAIDLDFEELLNPDALDDDDELTSGPQTMALMVPLSGGAATSGSKNV